MKIKNADDRPSLRDLNTSEELSPQELVNENLGIINENLFKVSRNLSYWDIYKLTTQVTEKNLVPTTLSALAPSESCVMNFEGSTTYAGITYSRGDVAYRTANGILGIIKSLSNGIYVPSSISDGEENTKIINYSFSQVVSSSSGSTSLTLESLNTSSPIYGYMHEISSSEETSYSFPKQTYNSVIIKPIIRFFSADNEVITADFSLTSSNENFEISNFPPIVKYIQVK